MRDHSHYSPENTGYCEHCGQPLPGQHVSSYGEKKPVNKVGIGVTVLLHLLLILVWILKPQVEKHAAPPSGGEMVYVLPEPKGKPSPKEQKPVATKPVKVSKPTVAKVVRLPNTITLPNEKPAKEVEPELVKPKPAPPEMDMAAAIEARRQARGQGTSEQPAEESEAARGNRVALANIAAANGRSQGNDRNDTGGVFELKNKTSLTATVKFRGWNPSFKRRWLQEVNVELGMEKDIETAVVKKMIEIIRKEKKGDFEWDSHREGRVVNLSARVEDTEELSKFLMREMFPENNRGRGR